MVRSVKRFTVAFWTKSGEKSIPICPPVHCLTYALRRLNILCQPDDSLWFRFSAFFRADPCLRLLEELEEDLKQRVQRMTVRGLHQTLNSTSYMPQDIRLIILGACNAHQTDVALPTAEMSSPRTCEAGTTRQPAEPASSSGHNTTIESMALTGNLRHRPTLFRDHPQVWQHLISMVGERIANGAFTIQNDGLDLTQSQPAHSHPYLPQIEEASNEEPPLPNNNQATIPVSTINLVYHQSVYIFALTIR